MANVKKYILLVEDEPAISDVQYKILTQAPIYHEVDIALNGQKAREMNTSVPILFISGNIEFLESIKMLKQKDPYLAHVSKPCMNFDYLNSINKLFESFTH